MAALSTCVCGGGEGVAPGLSAGSVNFGVYRAQLKCHHLVPCRLWYWKCLGYLGCNVPITMVGGCQSCQHRGEGVGRNAEFKPPAPLKKYFKSSPRAEGKAHPCQQSQYTLQHPRWQTQSSFP
ncbi:ras GTPase-activating protein 2 [Platysternon megacephalum]|uniref:Ras GTPase-activating protein 2 n=1 Tax=Platysternon megacephalum TaxID=55544 RepID=A0A4D9E012_9SAUR|nr:ras GTPase-activating protein 2 [Platysternon megacephalum]